MVEPWILRISSPSSSLRHWLTSFFFLTAEALTVEEPHSTFQRTSLDICMDAPLTHRELTRSHEVDSQQALHHQAPIKNKPIIFCQIPVHSSWQYAPLERRTPVHISFGTIKSIESV